MYDDEKMPYFDGDRWRTIIAFFDEDEGQVVWYWDCGDEFGRDVTERMRVAWVMRYYQSVAVTGKDPLNWLYAERDVTIKEVWQAAFYENFLGVGVQARKDSRGPWISGTALPEHVREFFDLRMDNDRPTKYMREETASTLEQLEEIVLSSSSALYWGCRRPRTLPGAPKWGRFKIERHETRSISQEELIRKAQIAYAENKVIYESLKEMK